jgi:hypothetical protein
MNQRERDELTHLIRVSSRHRLVAALTEVVAAEAKAQMAHTDSPGDLPLGWFADGMDTAVEIVRAELRPRKIRGEESA